MLGEGYH